jgi:DUF971 family protein
MRGILPTVVLTVKIRSSVVASGIMAAATIRKLREVGRYAAGIDWSDGHDSILPYRHLRQSCPCNGCVAAGPGELPAPATELTRMRTIGDGTLFLAWQDGHESLFVGAELRALCRCAHCIGEPNYPISGQ